MNILLKTNTNRHQLVKQLMLHGSFMYINFYTHDDTIPCITIEVSRLKPFAYYLNRASLQWILGYLQNGETEDLGISPVEKDIFSATQMEAELFYHCLQENISLSYNPLIRETTGVIEAIAYYPHGCIRFNIKRTPELLTCLKQFNQPINLLVG